MNHRIDDTGHYSMIIEWEPQDGIFIVTVPEMKGCRTHGSTYEEAVKHGQEVIELWIESKRAWGRPVPEPRYFDLDTIGAPTREKARVG